jgi:hypothetical protein
VAQTNTRRGAKRKPHDDAAGPESPAIGDADNHQFALVSFRVSERAKLELARRLKADGMPEAIYLRRVLYQHLGIPITGAPDPVADPEGEP